MDRLLGADWPFLALWLFFLSGALARGGFLHWVGRRVRRLGERRGELVARPGVLRAQRLVARYGAPAVTAGFLTVGLQSAVNIASGLLLMPLTRFVPALLAGAAIWATIYTTVGMSVLYAALGRAHWGWLAAAAAVVLLLVAVHRRVSRRSLRSGHEDAEAAGLPAALPAGRRLL